MVPENRRGKNGGGAYLLRSCFVGLLLFGLLAAAPDARADPLAVYPDGTLVEMAGNGIVQVGGSKDVIYQGQRWSLGEYSACWTGPVERLETADWYAMAARYPHSQRAIWFCPAPPPAPTTTTTQPPPPPPSDSREDRAVAWARAQVGQTHQPDGKPWNGWCDRFVANAYGRANSGYASAYAHWQDLERRGLVVRGDRNVPYGALAFYGPVSGNQYGHVQISVGGGTFVTTAQSVRYADINFAGNYLGWAWANPEWGGR